LNADLA
jgi:Domain of unknown function (DUF3342)/CHORD